MRKSYSLLALLLSLLTIYSCSNSINEFEEFVESTEVVQNESTDLLVKSLLEIKNPMLSKQLPISTRYMTDILSKEYGYLLDGYDLKDLSLDRNHVMIYPTTDGTQSYIFSVKIPNQENSDLDINIWLTLNFNSQENLSNYIQFGSEVILYFDSEGNTVQNKYYTPKPSNIPSKAPKSVICGYHWNGNMPSQVASYCGIYGGQTVPAPIEVLAALFPEWYVYSGGQWIKLSTPTANIPLTNDYFDLYYYSASGGQYPFIMFNINDFPGFKNEIIQYYGQVYIIQLGYAITNPYSMVSEETHVHKQAFLDSYLEWLYSLQSQAPANYNYLVANPSVMFQIFQFFAEYNLDNPEDNYTYLGQPWYIYQYSPNPDVKCMNTGAQFLFTSDGLNLMQDLGSGAIDINGFRNGLPDC
jgi:hypothetical protein